MKAPHPEVQADPVIALIRQRMIRQGVDRQQLGHALSAGRNSAKALRRLDQFLGGERFVPDFIEKVAEVLQIPAGQLAVARESRDAKEQELREASARRGMEEAMARRGPHLWGRLPAKYHPSLFSVLGAEFFLLIRLPEEFARLSSYEMIRDVGRAVREHYQHHRRCRLIGYDFRQSLDAVYRFDVDGEYVRRVEGEPLETQTFVRIGNREVRTPNQLFGDGLE